jgi:hypothetical protein
MISNKDKKLRIFDYSFIVLTFSILGDVPDVEDASVVVLSIPQYSRYRAILKRVAGKENFL